MGLPEQELRDDKMVEKYGEDTDISFLVHEQPLPLNKNMSVQVQQLLASGKVKRLDLGILFYISFHDLSSPCVQHLATL